MPAWSSLSAYFPSAKAGILHHNHPVLAGGAELCFELIQQSLAAGPVSVYHLPRNSISGPCGPKRSHSRLRIPEKVNE
jgi:hypothetical protein